MSEAGPATDRANDPVIDPTKNVRDLVSAENRRQDDLRALEAEHVREVIKIRAECQKDEVNGIQHIEKLRSDHARELRTAEAARIDAIRAVDVGAVQQAAQVQATQATTLAAQVATSAETLRTQVAAAASAATIALAAALEPVQKDIADLRRAQYEAQGQKQTIVETSGATRAWWAIAIAAAAIFSSGFIAVAGIAITLILKG